KFVRSATSRARRRGPSERLVTATKVHRSGGVAGYLAGVSGADHDTRGQSEREDSPEVEVRRSRRRRRTVTAYRDGDRVIVLIPARMTRAEERRWVAVMLDRLAAQERRRRPSDAA